ncbi:hypothetical protein NO1_1350, partial [Candidatus Termititenax aidoneus]
NTSDVGWDWILVDTQIPSGSITLLDSRVNGLGQTIVGDNSVKLRFNFNDVLKNSYASGVEKVLFSLNNAAATDIIGANTTSGGTAKTFDYDLGSFSLSNGVKNFVTVNFVDYAGNQKTVTTAFTVVAGGLVATASSAVTINNGDTYTNTINVKLSLKSTNAVSMNISNSAAPGGWINYVEHNNSYAWTLTTGDGLKTVYVKYRDALGNEVTVTDDIYLDTTAPAGTLEINGGEALTKNPVLRLTLSASDAGSGLASVNISETNLLSASWQSCEADFEYTLNDQTRNQEKTIYVWLKDQAGNISAAVTRSIYLTDVGGSGGEVKINNDMPYTNTRNVTLAFSEIHAEAYDMQISDDAAARWVSVNTALDWTLSSGDGTKIISVEYRNMAGNVTWNGDSGTIILDTTAPAGTLEINGGGTTTDTKVLRLKLTGPDDAVSMNINETDAWLNWQSYLAQSDYTLLDTATGNKTIYVWLKDRAGNISATISAGIILTDAAGSTVPDAAAPAADAPIGKKIYSYPNPAQPRKEDVTIVYGTDKDGTVNIYLYNLLGEKIWSASGYAKAGEKNKVIWNGRDAYGAEVGNGVYILLLANEQKKVLARGRLTVLDD